jgi:hypothetical protein
MKNKFAMLMVVLLAVTAAASLHPVLAQDNSSTNPAAVGAPVRSMVELGSVYSNIYDITITVLETVRGTEAMNRLKAASPSNGTPAEGFEYILARIKFEHKGRAVSDNLPFDLKCAASMDRTGSGSNRVSKSIRLGTQSRTGRNGKTRPVSGGLGGIRR